MEERRKLPRARTLKAGRIIFNHRRSVIDCTVRNLTRAGALLVVPDTLGVPDAFDLELDASAHPCQVIWRRDDRLGVAFR